LLICILYFRSINDRIYQQGTHTKKKYCPFTFTNINLVPLRRQNIFKPILVLD